MFRKVYIRLLLLMSVTILVLLWVIEVTTYVVFSRRLQMDGQVDLLTQVTEVSNRVAFLYSAQQHRQQNRDRPFENQRTHKRSLDSLSDDTGENVYFFVTGSDNTIQLASSGPPARPQAVERAANLKGFSIVQISQRPYRVYAEPYSVHGRRGTLYVYQLISREQTTLADISTILWIAGAFGGAFVVLLNLWLAKRALDPARKSWESQQAMLLELSHELKTPLATITAILSSGAAPNTSRLILENHHATSLLEEILYFAHLQSTILQTSEPVAVSDITEDTISRFEPLAFAQGMSIQGRAERGIYVKTTVERWSHLVSILCKNATQHGKQQSSITWNLSATSSQVRLEIENEIGVKQVTSEVVSGIGLRIAKRLVNDMHGNLEQTSSDGKMMTVIVVPRCKMS